MQQETQAAGFDIEEARRVLGDVFAPLGAGPRPVGRAYRIRSSIRRSGRLAAGGDPAHGIFRAPVPERRHRLRSGVDGVRRHFHGDRDTCGEPRLSADDDSRSNHAFHARCHLLRRAGGSAGGSVGAHHELRPRHPVRRNRHQAGGDRIERVCDAVTTRQKLQHIVLVTTARSRSGGAGGRLDDQAHSDCLPATQVVSTSRFVVDATMSARAPALSVPRCCSIPKNRAGTSDAARSASSREIPTSVTAFLNGRCQVEMSAGERSVFGDPSPRSATKCQHP
jgi:hypothetical protein